jgi:hypothetical protein
MRFPYQFPATFGSAPTTPPDTDQYIYRYVTKYRSDQVISELTQIAITQP